VPISRVVADKAGTLCPFPVGNQSLTLPYLTLTLP
jgi:hypothetical protein